MPLLSMINTVESSEILKILEQYNKQQRINAESSATANYRPYQQLSRKEKDMVDYIEEELNLDNKMVAVIAAQELEEDANTPGILRSHFFCQ